MPNASRKPASPVEVTRTARVSRSRVSQPSSRQRRQISYRHYGIDAEAILAAAQALTPGRPIRYLRALG